MSGSNIWVAGTGIELPPIIGDLYAAATINSGTGTGTQTLVTGSPGYILTRILIAIDPTCTIASAGMIQIAFVDTGSGATVGALRAYVPASFTAPTVPTVSVPYISNSGYWFRSRSVGSTLTIASNTALTAGSIRASCNYALINQDS